MIKTIEVVGIQLDNYTVRETIMNLERDMQDQGFHTIEEVNTNTLMLAVADKDVRAALTVLEYTVISEIGILEAVGAASYQRRHEIEHHDFFHELMRRIERNRRSVYVIGDTPERTEAMVQFLSERYQRCPLAGTVALEGLESKIDAVINEINAVTPDVVISILPSPKQERFLLENKDKLSANLWYGIGTLALTNDKRSVTDFFRRSFRTYKLKKQINSYCESQGSV